MWISYGAINLIEGNVPLGTFNVINRIIKVINKYN